MGRRSTLSVMTQDFLGGVLLTGLVLLTAGCLDGVPDPETAPRRRPPVVSSDGPGARGTTARPPARRRAVTGATVPGGLGMRGDPATRPSRPVVGVKLGSAAGKAPWKGGPKAKVLIEEFTDFECPFCKKGWRIMERVLAYYGGRVRLVFRHTPIPQIHKQAMQAAEAAVCAQRQGKFWAMQEQLWKNNHKLSRADLIRYARLVGLDVPRFTKDLDGGKCKARVLADMKLAKKRGVSGTPTFFVNGQKVDGAYPFKHFKRLIDVELDD